MVRKLIDWINNNKFVTVLLLVGCYLFLGVFFKILTNTASGRIDYDSVTIGGAPSYDIGSEYGAPLSISSKSSLPYNYEAPPQPEITDRKVITDSTMSLHVTNVSESVERIKEKVLELSGYVTKATITRTDFSEISTVQLRVPSKDLEQMLSFLRGLSIKVVSENISGTDITDRYVDIEGRIARLESTRERLEDRMEKATTLDDILNIDRHMDNLQNQIDAYKGQLLYMDKASETTKITIYLSTDELGLPYSPAETFRPEVVFKKAVRHMLGTVNKLAGLGIWLFVYSPLLLIGLIFYISLKRFWKRTHYKPDRQ